MVVSKVEILGAILAFQRRFNVGLVIDRKGVVHTREYGYEMALKSLDGMFHIVA